MEELIARISAATGITPEKAEQAAGTIFAFLKKEGPSGAVDSLLDSMPGAQDAAANAASAATGGGGMLGGLMGKMGGGIMALAGQLTGLGLGMGEMQAVGKEIFAFAREKVGDEKMGEISAAVPGLAQFL